MSKEAGVRRRVSRWGRGRKGGGKRGKDVAFARARKRRGGNFLLEPKKAFISKGCLFFSGLFRTVWRFEGFCFSTFQRGRGEKEGGGMLRTAYCVYAGLKLEV